MTAAPEWVAALGDRDPSVPIGLAAIVRAAGPTETIAFSDLVHSYREAYLACYQPTGDADQEVSGDEVRHHLRGSVLPRLAMEGWILDSSSGYWQTVRPRVGWWGPTQEERQAVYEALLASARRAVQRAKSFTKRVPSTSLLEGLNLTKSFKGRCVVDDVSVRVEQGEIVGLLGPNGAGKTTTFYLITGLIRPDEGRVRLDGVELTEMPMYQRARNGIGYLAQEPSVFRKMTVEENVLAILETRGLSRDERYSRLDHMLDELSIKHLRKSKAYTLSGGERRRLGRSRARWLPTPSSCCWMSRSLVSTLSRFTISRPSSPASGIVVSAC
jgi:lipopolysaccharide export system ATP-binding protein